MKIKSEVKNHEKAYEITYKVGQNTVTKTVKAYTVIGATYVIAAYGSCENVICIKEITFERYHALNISFAIANADKWEDCEYECCELCRLAGMESEWLEADGDTFEEVLIEAAKKLNVEI